MKFLRNFPFHDLSTRNGDSYSLDPEDVPEIVAACKELQAQGNPVIEIDRALHGDIFLLEETFGRVVKQLAVWFGNT